MVLQLSFCTHPLPRFGPGNTAREPTHATVTWAPTLWVKLMSNDMLMVGSHYTELLILGRLYCKDRTWRRLWSHDFTNHLLNQSKCSSTMDDFTSGTNISILCVFSAALMSSHLFLSSLLYWFHGLHLVTFLWYKENTWKSLVEFLSFKMLNVKKHIANNK